MFKYFIFSLYIIFLITLPLPAQENIFVEDEDYGDRLKIGYVWKGAPSFNPLVVSTDYEKEFSNLVFGEGLFTKNDSGNVVNYLALSNRLYNSNNRFVLRIQLRPNLTFHDGTIITAEDVKLTYDLYKKFSFQSRLLYNASLIRDIDVYPGGIIRIFFDSRPNNFSETIGLLPILPANISNKLLNYNSISDLPFINPVGFGNFRLTDYKNKESITLDSYKNHTLGQSYLSGIDFLFYESQDLLLDAFLQEEVDLIQINDKSEVQKINQFSKKLVRLEDEFKNLYYINVNTKQVPFNNFIIRRTINYAINREQISNNLFNGNGSESLIDIKENSSDDLQFFIPPEYKPLEAIQILYNNQFKKNNQGKLVKNNKELQFELYIQKGSSFEESIARIIAINLGDIGINVVPISIESDQLNKKISRGQYQAILRTYNYNPSNESETLRNFYYNELRNINGYRNFSNTGFDVILNQIKSSNGEDKNQNLSIQFQRLLQRSSPCIFLFSKGKDIYAINPRFENIITEQIKSNGNVVNLFKPKHEWFVKKDNQKY